MSQTVEEIHATSIIKEVEVAKLRVDTSYQRDFSENLVDEIANNWDQVAAELITVSDRGTRTNDPDVEGGLWIVNGQHRSKAAQKRGMKTIWARVIDLKKAVDPAQLEAGFRLKTGKRLGDRPLERFKAQLRAFDEESLSIERILTKFETEINRASNPEHGINCVSTIETLYRLDNDGSLLSDTLEVVKDTWGKVEGQYAKADLLKGVCWFVEKHAEESDRTRLVTKLKGLGNAPLSSRAHAAALGQGGALWLNYYKAIVDLYNEQLREKNRLHYKIRGRTAMGAIKAGV